MGRPRTAHPNEVDVLKERLNGRLLLVPQQRPAGPGAPHRCHHAGFDEAAGNRVLAGGPQENDADALADGNPGLSPSEATKDSSSVFDWRTQPVFNAAARPKKRGPVRNGPRSTRSSSPAHTAPASTGRHGFVPSPARMRSAKRRAGVCPRFSRSATSRTIRSPWAMDDASEEDSTIHAPSAR